MTFQPNIPADEFFKVFTEASPKKRIHKSILENRRNSVLRTYVPVLSTKYEFIYPNFDFSNDYEIRARELYSSYKIWCEINHEKNTGRNNLYKKLQRLGLKYHVTGKRKYFKGIKLSERSREIFDNHNSRVHGI